jgi:hypothetical protein
LRLMGLPNVKRWPHATVWMGDEEVDIAFSGGGGEQRIQIPLRIFGGVEDPESFELRLLAQLQALGYEVTRARE